MTLTVDIVSGGNAPQTHEITKSQINIGRSGGSDIRLHPTLDTESARDVHATVERYGDHIMLTVKHANGITILHRDGHNAFLPEGEQVIVETPLDFRIGKNGPQLTIRQAEDDMPHTAMMTLPVGDSDSGDSGATAQIPPEPPGRPKRNRIAKYLAVVGAATFVVFSAADLFSSQQHMNGRIDGLTDGQAMIQSAVSSLAGQQNELAREQSQINSAVPANVLDEVAQSVSLLGARNADGVFEAIGTGWTAGDNVLATNAHVAEGLIEQREMGYEIIALRGPNLSIELSLGDIQLHPGWETWKRRFNNLTVPYYQGGSLYAELIPAFDVATVQVTAGDAGKPLEIASIDELTVREGLSVAYAGFPGEWMAGLPAMQRVSGSITAVTDFFFQRDDFTNNYLLHHNADTVGGASGSPLVDRFGRVVGLVSAGNFIPAVVPTRDGIDINNPTTARTPVGLNYAQRADLLLEMLDDTAESNQQKRDDAWAEEMWEHFESVEDLLSEFIDVRSEEHDVDGFDVVELKVELDEYGFGQVDIDVDAGTLYFFLVSTDFLDPLWFSVEFENLIGQAGWYRMPSMRIDPQDIDTHWHVEIEGPESTTVNVYILRAQS